jgi:hypothetical protein
MLLLGILIFKVLTARRLYKSFGFKGLNPSSTSYPDHGHYGDLPLKLKIPTAEP